MKLVINRCYGGFSLSPRAIKRIAELDGKPCFFFTCEWKTHTYTQVTMEQAAEEFTFHAFTVPNPVEVAGSQASFHDMSMEDRQLSNERWEAISLESRPRDRANPNLVRAVEELGDAANGSHAELAIVEIPDGVSWEISEYDGMETIEETHRSWC